MTRDFAVATFVVDAGKVLLLFHRKLGKWLPPGGHIEPGELPDDAAVREVYEETGVRVELVGERGIAIDNPRQLIIPQGVQLEQISENHQHIDFVYFARPVSDTTLHANHESEQLGWYGKDELKELPLTHEITLWIEKALKALS